MLAEEMWRTQQKPSNRNKLRNKERKINMINENVRSDNKAIIKQNFSPSFVSAFMKGLLI